MAYTTLSDLESAAGGAARLLELADWDGDGVVDADELARNQAEADGWIDSHLRHLSKADLAALRAAPTPTIVRLAADETVDRIRAKRRGDTELDLERRKMRIEELTQLRMDKLRPADTKTTRAAFFDNEGDVSRDGLKGQW